MKVGAFQFPSFEDFGSPLALATRLPSPEVSAYVRTISPLWDALCSRGDSWTKELRRNLPLKANYPEIDAREQRFRECSAQAVAEKVKTYFDILHQRIQLLRTCEIQEPDSIFKGRLRGTHPEHLGQSMPLPLGAMMWEMPKLCVVWIDVPLTERLVSTDRDEGYCADWTYNRPLINKWLGKYGVDGNFEVFLRETNPENTANNDWFELEWDRGDKEYNLDVAGTVIWTILEKAGSQDTVREMAEKLAPREELDLTGETNLADIQQRAIELAPDLDL